MDFGLLHEWETVRQPMLASGVCKSETTNTQFETLAPTIALDCQADPHPSHHEPATLNRRNSETPCRKHW